MNNKNIILVFKEVEQEKYFHKVIPSVENDVKMMFKYINCVPCKRLILMHKDVKCYKYLWIIYIQK